MPSIPDKSKIKVIRLALYGCTNRPFYRIVVTGNRRPRNYKPAEQIGTYDPLPNDANERLVAINFERLNFFVGHGAKISKPVAKLLGIGGYLPIHPMTHIQADRMRRASSEQEKTRIMNEMKADADADG